MAGTLYMVPTPVGNLEDMTPRAINVLQSCNLILAEDTRTSGKLLKYFDITTPLASFHKFNEHDVIETFSARLVGGENIALITDAGTPGISDPGFLLARECRRLDIRVVTLPGATAFVPALVNSGLPCERFTFEGFLPVKKGRAKRLSEIAERDCTSIVYESPLRLVKTLEQLAEACGSEREISVSREISKLFEDTQRGTIGELIEHYKSNPPKGEIVIITSGNPKSQEKTVHRNKYKSDCD